MTVPTLGQVLVTLLLFWSVAFVVMTAALVSLVVLPWSVHPYLLIIWFALLLLGFGTWAILVRHGARAVWSSCGDRYRRWTGGPRLLHRLGKLQLASVPRRPKRGGLED